LILNLNYLNNLNYSSVSKMSEVHTTGKCEEGKKGNYIYKNISNINYHLLPVLKILSTVLLSVSLHIVSVKFYNYYCISDGWFSILHSIIYMPTPQCRILIDIIKYTSDLYILFWTTLFSSVLLNYKLVRNSLTSLKDSIKYFKN
jgi:hypothetical protein